MTVEELAGRLTAVEVIAMTALGMYLANARNDADYGKAAALIEHLRQAISAQSKALPAAAEAHAIQHGKELLDTVEQNLRALRGEGGQLN
jgi:hypothetical protein